MFENNVKDFFGFNKTKGDVGIEIEMEVEQGINWTNSIKETWHITTDGSLKSDWAYEVVLKKPIPLENVSFEVEKLKAFIAKYTKIMPSIRAGIHVHINMHDSTLAQVFRMMMCYYPLETALTKFCGEGREGNLFCLRARDAEYVLDAIRDAVEVEDMYLLRTNSLRYAALNFQSLFKFGTLESRALATTPDLSKIVEWCDILMKIKKYSREVDCWEHINNISGEGPRNWMANVIGEEYTQMIEYPGMEGDIIRDVRNMQHTCHSLKMKGV